jgi:hypothetical protein
MRRKDAMALKKGDVVWLKPFEDQPREKCTLLTAMTVKGMFIGQVRQTKTDDGLREFDHKQVESKV